MMELFSSFQKEYMSQLREGIIRHTDGIMFCLRSFFVVPKKTCQYSDRNMQNRSNTAKMGPILSWYQSTILRQLVLGEPITWKSVYKFSLLFKINQNHQPCRNISPITSESFCRIGTGWPWLTNCYLQILRLLMCGWCGTKRNELTARRLGRHTDKQECRWGGCRSECGMVNWLLGDREQVAGEAGECGM